MNTLLQKARIKIVALHLPSFTQVAVVTSYQTLIVVDPVTYVTVCSCVSFSRHYDNGAKVVVVPKCCK